MNNYFLLIFYNLKLISNFKKYKLNTFSIELKYFPNFITSLKNL